MTHVPAVDALRRLREGNLRFIAGENRALIRLSPDRRAELTAAQSPFAIVLGCADSRVPAEFVFDQGLGDLFVIRVAGNIVAPSLVGSVEFAAGALGTRLVVVLGHTLCGAIRATLDSLRTPSASSWNLKAITERIRPAVESVLSADPDKDPQELERLAVRANIRASADHLRHGSEVLERLIRDHGLIVVGAEYCLETGKVEFFDGVPEGG